MKRALLVVVALVGCKKHEAVPVPVAVPAPAPQAEDVHFRPKHTLTSTAKGSAFELSDGTGDFHITLPNQPTLSADMMEQGGVQVWNAQAVMPGGDVDVQFGAMAVPDGDLPADLSNMAGIPQQLATMTNGDLVKNDSGTLSGKPAQIFEAHDRRQAPAVRLVRVRPRARARLSDQLRRRGHRQDARGVRHRRELVRPDEGLSLAQSLASCGNHRVCHHLDV